ncbi:MAG: exodeoxyribonuclease VII small subunit [candidate division NC10 bacterium]|nr:exodeoxyribonuclease VII small subunit [candidate division NC10 bacterium]
MDVEEVRFEEALKQLEAIVSRLELGDLPLEEALSIFEEGIRVTKLCSQRLSEAERRVNILVRNADSATGELEERPFPVTSIDSVRSLSEVEACAEPSRSGPALSPAEGEEEAGEGQ